MGHWKFRYPGPAAVLLGFLVLAQQILTAQSVADVLLVVNDASQLSRAIGQYYAARRGVPPKNICHIRTTTTEDIARAKYDQEIAGAVGACLTRNRLTEQVLYIVTTGGVPLKIPESSKASGMQGDYAAVDSELALLYSDLKRGQPHPIAGPAINPFFGRRDSKFGHPEFPMYLVTRLAAYDLAGVKALIDVMLMMMPRPRASIPFATVFAMM